ncbi:unnamed protein product [Caenorhabditis brenneri]
MFTVLFCVLRAATLYSLSDTLSKVITRVSCFVILVIACLAAIPHFSTDGVCIPKGSPYPFGAILIISQFYLSNPSAVSLEDMIFNGVACLIIIVLKGFMVRKLDQRRSLNTLQSVNQTAKIERTLTRTIIILLIPLVVNFVISTMVLFQVFQFAPSLISHLSMIRPALLDARTHIVTLYFYFTNPIFKNDKITFKVSTSQNLRS